MKRVLKIFIPLLILTAGVAFIFVFEFYMKDRINTTPVLVAAQDIEFKETVSAKHIKVEYVKREHVVDDSFTLEQSDEIIGQVAAVDIKRGTQLYPALIDSFDLVPNTENGEFIAPIPNKWIYAVPGSLRRSYYADFYVTPELTDKPIIGEESESIPLRLERKPILTNVKILYTKDASNREVRSIEEDQFDATANISNLEVIATEEMLHLIRSYIKEGYTLYITYSFSEKS